MKNTRLARVIVEQDIKKNQTIELNEHNTHYIKNVMRLKENDSIIIINGRDGQWHAKILKIGKKSITISPSICTKNQENDSNIILAFAPIKQPRLEFMFEKSTELGVNKFIPLITKYSNREKTNYQRLHSKINEAVEQSERLTIPIIENPIILSDFIENLSDDAYIILCNEHEVNFSISELSDENLTKYTQIYIIIGPEGGFSEDEIEILTNKKNIRSIHLGKRILRAETAAIAAISIVTVYANQLGVKASRE